MQYNCCQNTERLIDDQWGHAINEEMPSLALELDV